MKKQPSEFGVRLRELREAAGLTQEELAERAGLTAQAVSALERGHRRQPYPHTVRALAGALGEAESTLQVLVAAARPEANDASTHAGAEPAVPLPTGTVTFLLTDVQGSTRLWELDSEAMRQAMVRHDALIEQLVTHHTGNVVRARGEGDSCFAVFASASDAVAAARAIQVALHQEHWPLAEPLRVRIALHTGEADLRDGDYFGTVVNRCVRLRSAAHGGQILISEALANLVAATLPDHLLLRDLGPHRLKDLLRPERIFQLLVRGVDNEFPPLVGLDSGLHNLPVQVTSLIGRERFLPDLRLRLTTPDVRLVTLIGPGGTGKTRVALQCAADLLDHFEHGAWFVDLAPISDSALVLPAIAHVLQVKEEAGRSFAGTLKDRIADKSQLLVLDNFEQVLPAAPLIADVLSGCPRLKVLVTSRAVLALQGEQVFPVSPLEVPNSSSPTSSVALAEVESIQLFVQRARAARPDFELNDDNVAAVAAICQRLDGLPLAIELAAARVRLLGPDALLARLDRRLSVLTSGPRDSATRHQTLRAAMAWSYDLLEPAEQVLFRRLAVHVGGWTLEAAEALCKADADAGLDALDGMAALVDKCLVTEVLPSEGPTNSRFRMLETIREYAVERLESGEAERVRDWHLRHYLALAETAATHLDGNEQVIWLARLDEEHDNLRAALGWAMESGQTALGLRLAGALGRFWLIRGHLSEGRQHLESALADTAAVMAPIRARALHASGLLAQYQNDYQLAAAQCTESLELYRAIGDRVGMIATLQALGRIARLRGDHAGCRSLYQESLTLSNEIGDRRTAAQAQMGWGQSFWWAGDTARARPLLMNALTTFQALGDLRGSSDARTNLAFVSYFEGDLSGAQRLHEDAMAVFRRIGDKRGIARSVHGLANVAEARGDYHEAATLYETAVLAFASLGERWFMFLTIAGLARVAERLAGANPAARLLGLADALLTPEVHWTAYGFSAIDTARADLRQQLGEERFAAAWSEGREMTPEQAVALLRSAMNPRAASIDPLHG